MYTSSFFLNIYCCLPSTTPALSIVHSSSTLNLPLCNNTHIHSTQTANCFSHSPPRPTFGLSHLQNKLCWKFHYKLPCVCQIPPGAKEIKTLHLPAPTETDLSLTHTEVILTVFSLVILTIVIFLFMKLIIQLFYTDKILKLRDLIEKYRQA